MERVETTDTTWFEKMEGYLDWKIVGPDIHNPYERTFTTRMIAQLAYDRTLLKQLLNIRCLCDGFEVLLIENANTPVIHTDHPCLSLISRAALLEYLRKTGINDLIEAEMTRIQEEMREELKRRDKLEYAQAQHEKQKALELKRDERKRKHLQKDHDSVGDQRYRIMKK